MDDLQVRLVSGPPGSQTGLSRYTRCLRDALAREGVVAQLVSSQLPLITRQLAPVFRKIGLDPVTFFTTYPIVISRDGRSGITHLTSQNLASALAFRHLPNAVVTVHDLITLVGRHDPAITGYLRFYDRLFDQIALRGLRSAKALIADSEHTRTDIMHVVRFIPERVRVVPLGVDHTRFQHVPVPPDFWKRYGLDPSARYVIYIGSEDPRKNLLRLIEAFRLVSTDCPKVMLLKVGAARFHDERVRLVAQIRDLGLTGRVRFIDSATDEDLPRFYSLATVFAYPSLYEGFGLPPLEAMACGTPVVTSNTSSLPEVVGDAGIMVDPRDVGALANALELLLIDEAAHRTYRERGLARARQFTWERAARAHVEVYRGLVSNS